MEPKEEEIDYNDKIEVINEAKLISLFYTSLIHNGVPSDLAGLLTRDYLNYRLSLEEEEPADDSGVIYSWGTAG